MELWKAVVGMGELAESQALDTIVNGSGQGMRVCWRQRLQAMRTDLGYAESSALERLLIQQVTLCWLNLNLTEYRHIKIVETPNKVEGEGEYSTIKALGQEVAACSTVYFWPKENRPLGDNDKVGILHVKCAVADGEWLFLSSANLTQQAFMINMELGMLVRGGTIPSRVEQQFDRLIQSAQLKEV